MCRHSVYGWYLQLYQKSWLYRRMRVTPTYFDKWTTCSWILLDNFNFWNRNRDFTIDLPKIESLVHNLTHYCSSTLCLTSWQSVGLHDLHHFRHSWILVRALYAWRPGLIITLHARFLNCRLYFFDNQKTKKLPKLSFITVQSRTSRYTTDLQFK